jgi:YD repeat-containing protein
MKKVILFVFSALLVFSCDHHGKDPEPEIPNLVPIKMEDVDGYRELMYDVNGKVVGVSIVTKFVDGTELRNVQTLVRDTSGKLIELTTDTGSRMVYVYDGEGKVSRTEEYVNDVWSQRHEYIYNEKGLLKENITYQDIPEEGGLIPVSKDVYSYDGAGNVTLQVLYHYTPFGVDAKILTTTTFSDYDSKINTERYFAINPFNPFVKVRNNNPGKMVIRNAAGATKIVETYEYKYNAEGYTTEKTSYVTMDNGNSGSFTTTYTFK